MLKQNHQTYKMPAEWHSHAATQLHWPSNKETWPGERLHKVEQVYLDIIEALHKYEPILLLYNSDINEKTIRSILQRRDINLEKIFLYQVPVNDVWARDCGPIFVKNNVNNFAITDWDYNAWGGKYPPFDSDNALPKWFSDMFHIPLFRPGMVLEGGSIETNGEGIFLTTESVLLNKNRNPELSKTEIEQKLYAYLGAEQVIWLKDGLTGDDTDGHIDDLSRFINKNTILTTVCEDENDINYRALQENLNILQQAVDLQGNLFQIVNLPLPKTKIEGTTVDGSEYVPASYANFYIANGVVLVPLYDRTYDDIALDIFSNFFPERDIIGIECADLVWGQGSIHCITQQLYGLNMENI